MYLVADTHVHLYDCYDLRALFLGAMDRLEQYAREIVPNADCARAIFLTERSGSYYFDRLRDEPHKVLGSEFRVGTTEDRLCLRVVADNGGSLLVFSGRQIATKERLEVLALMSDAQFEDGDTFEVSLRRVIDCGALAVIPWSLGKWWGRRGQLLSEVVKLAKPGEIALGDCVRRSRLALPHRLFAAARDRGLAVLCGSDPLPFAGQEAVVGTYASVFPDSFDSAMPSQSIIDIAKTRPELISSVGRRALLVV
ncbi:MAG: hypothetical protein K1X79_07315 [Oligoflexia bacterium]|nr:hypothetical protein [Oligoflexia bacterium]